MKDIWKKIPKLPLSALIFYLLILLLWKIGIIPSPSDIIVILENIYKSYGLVGLSIAAFLEGIVYLGMYFPGSFVIALAIFISDGTFKSLITITLIVAITWTITSTIDYLLGRYLSRKKTKPKKDKKFSIGFLLAFFHQNILAFYFFHEGLEKRHPWKLLITFPIMFIWGFFVVFLFSILRTPLRHAIESPHIMISLIFMWIIVSFLISYGRKIK